MTLAASRASAGVLAASQVGRPRADPSPHEQLGRELDALKARITAELGAEDVRYVRRLDRISRSLEAIGRVLIHFSFEPISFALGVISLWLHKQLQSSEIGHTALHGAYDKLPGGAAFASKQYRWDTPIDEESWRQGHNIQHHGNTNVAGKDPDIHFGPVRLTPRTPHTPRHAIQLPFTLLVLFPAFGFLMNLHFTGLLDAYMDNGQPEQLDFLRDRSRASRLAAWKRALRKYLPYYAWNFGFFPALAGPFFWKVLLGNVLAEIMRDVYSAATIYCGHVGADAASYAHGVKARSRGEWYAMQIEATNDFEVSLPVSILCGGLDRQIEHHLFPTLPPPRLRQIASEVRAICERNGLVYKTASWPLTLRKALAQVARLSKDGGVGEVLRSMS